jgi:hypothetical protein
MVTVPPLIAASTPVTASIVARAVLLLLHVPPDVALLIVILLPVHGLETPVVAAKPAFTVSWVVVRQLAALI